jgi:hypothetical protein
VGYSAGLYPCAPTGGSWPDFLISPLCLGSLTHSIDKKLKIGKKEIADVGKIIFMLI